MTNFKWRSLAHLNCRMQKFKAWIEHQHKYRANLSEAEQREIDAIYPPVDPSGLYISTSTAVSRSPVIASVTDSKGDASNSSGEGPSTRIHMIDFGVYKNGQFFRPEGNKKPGKTPLRPFGVANALGTFTRFPSPEAEVKYLMSTLPHQCWKTVPADDLVEFDEDLSAAGTMDGPGDGVRLRRSSIGSSGSQADAAESKNAPLPMSAGQDDDSGRSGAQTEATTVLQLLRKIISALPNLCCSKTHQFDALKHWATLAAGVTDEPNGACELTDLTTFGQGYMVQIDDTEHGCWLSGEKHSEDAINKSALYISRGWNNVLCLRPTCFRSSCKAKHSSAIKACAAACANAAAPAAAPHGNAALLFKLSERKQTVSDAQTQDQDQHQVQADDTRAGRQAADRRCRKAHGYTLAIFGCRPRCH